MPARQVAETTKLDLSGFKSEYTLSQRFSRLIWGVVHLFLFRFSPRFCFSWRRLILRAFGADVGAGVRVYPSTRIFFPRGLTLGDYSVIGPDVDIYNVGPITIGANSIVSQYSYLCAATHDHTSSSFPLIKRPIKIADQVWVAADAYVGPGVSIGQGAVVGARASVYKDVEAWAIVGGNPAKIIGTRSIHE